MPNKPLKPLWLLTAPNWFLNEQHAKRIGWELVPNAFARASGAGMRNGYRSPEGQLHECPPDFIKQYGRGGLESKFMELVAFERRLHAAIKADPSLLPNRLSQVP